MEKNLIHKRCFVAEAMDCDWILSALTFMFDIRYHEMFDSPAARIFLIGCILIILGSAVSPAYLSFKMRLRSFIGHSDEAEALLWAKDGFHSDGRGGATCCHCGAHAEQTTPAGPSERSRCKHRSNCTLWRLRQLLCRRESVPLAEIMSDIINFDRMFSRLSNFLRNSQTGFVMHFGFLRAETALAALRLFVSKCPDGQEWRPRQLIEVLNGLSMDSEVLGRMALSLIRSVVQREAASEDDEGNSASALPSCSLTSALMTSAPKVLPLRGEESLRFADRLAERFPSRIFSLHPLASTAASWRRLFQFSIPDRSSSQTQPSLLIKGLAHKRQFGYLVGRMNREEPRLTFRFPDCKPRQRKQESKRNWKTATCAVRGLEPWFCCHAPISCTAGSVLSALKSVPHAAQTFCLRSPSFLHDYAFSYM